MVIVFLCRINCCRNLDGVAECIHAFKGRSVSRMATEP